MHPPDRVQLVRDAADPASSFVSATEAPPPKRSGALFRSVPGPGEAPHEALDADSTADSTPTFAGAEMDADGNLHSLENRRQIRRAAFASKVPAFGSRALRVLVGRDLSVEGMRVESSPDLAVGDRLHLAIYGNPDEEPFLVWATVDRDDGERGMAIAFDDLHPVVAEKLEQLVGSLPSVEALHDDEAEAMGTVIGEMLPPEGS